MDQQDDLLKLAAPVPADFACRRCGACCRWEGDVRISQEEAEAIAAFLGLPVADFVAQLTRLARDRRGLSLAERPDGACVFYLDEPPGCRIYPVRPQQCRDFPRGWSFPGWDELCRAGRAD